MITGDDGAANEEDADGEADAFCFWDVEEVVQRNVEGLLTVSDGDGAANEEEADVLHFRGVQSISQGWRDL